MSTGAEPRFHGLNSAIRLGMGFDGDEGVDTAPDTRIVERGEELSETVTDLRGGEAVDEDGDCGPPLL